MLVLLIVVFAIYAVRLVVDILDNPVSNANEEHDPAKSRKQEATDLIVDPDPLAHLV